ncbi:hypothetical protein L6452_21675 [Arctium lappa]|uniref:Uncharacterized protein n=1 Tax=Arctium lappa TaxID=4217 RepID=A0ACB9AYZ6_ARCLA|nr:hypothetical protein L6452_21675 [Arctium lappa]
MKPPLATELSWWSVCWPSLLRDLMLYSIAIAGAGSLGCQRVLNTIHLLWSLMHRRLRPFYVQKSTTSAIVGIGSKQRV